MNMWDVHYQRRHRHPPLFADELPDTPAYTPPPWNQCIHGGDFEPRCTRIGTYKIRPDLLPTDERLRLWVHERTRYCEAHAGIYCVPANDEVGS